MNKEETDEIEKQNEVFKSSVRTSIMRLLYIYRELSLPDLSKYLNMNKSSIYHHLKILKDLDFIEESKRTEKVRGSIKKKYFKLKNEKTYNLDLDQLDIIKEDEIRKLKFIKLLKSWNQHYNDFNNLFQYYNQIMLYNEQVIENLEKFSLTKKQLDRIKDEVNKNNIGIVTFEFTEKQFTEYVKIFKEFIDKIYKMQEEIRSDPLEVRPYIDFHFTMPIKNMIENLK